MADISDKKPVSVRVLVPDGGELETPEEGEADDEASEASEQEAADGDEGETQGEASDEAESDGNDETDDESQEEEAEAEAEEEDGGEDETAGEEEDEAESGEEGEEEDEAEGEEEAEDEPQSREEAEREAAEADDGTRILHLSLDGLFLDLLGLEVDLDEVTLDLTARPGEGNLLGNLLAAVSDLLGGDGLGSLLGDGDGGLLPEMPSMPSLSDLPNPMDRARELAGRLADRIRELFDDAVSALPLEDLLSQFLKELVSQLLDKDNGDDEGDAAASA